MKKGSIEDLYIVLEAFSKEPPAELWDNIETKLHPKKKKRRIFFLWGSAAAVLVMLLGYMFTISPEPNSQPLKGVTDIEESKTNDAINESNHKTTKIVEGANITTNTNEDSLVQKIRITKKALNNVTSKKQLTDKGKTLNNVVSQIQLTNKNEIVEQKEERKDGLYEKNINVKDENLNYNNSYSQNIINEEDNKVNNKNFPDLQRKNKSVIDYKKEKLIASNDSIAKVKDISSLDSLEKLATENENIIDSIITNKRSNLKWSVEVLGGIANTASDASIQGTSVNTTSQNNFVYTLKVGYSISDRLVIKSGIGKNILGQEINSIKYTVADASLFDNNSQSIINNQSILFLVSQESINDFSSLAETANEGTLEQQFDYIQVPLEFSYNVLRAKKFDVSLGVGGNINFLTNNRAFLDNEQIGESLGANATILGATLKSNISFKLAKKTILFLEPSYNYFEKPIGNNNQTFNNTQLRVLFGLRYKL
ncbi:hypothetical protein N8216_01465 [Flavobacteriaceae bacterium]|nr:hypothetical protein [Flavobacteriaceae bacterium]